MTVQELIDELSKVEDKSKIIQVYSDNVYEDANTISEYDDTILIFDYGTQDRRNIRVWR